MQLSLIHERIEDAMDEVIRVCGGRKKFACDLWPDKPQRDAHNLLDACLNPERREKFSPSQLMYILKRGKAESCHAFMNYFAAECGYECTPISTELQEDRLITVVEESSKALASALATLQQLKAKQ